MGWANRTATRRLAAVLCALLLVTGLAAGAASGAPAGKKNHPRPPHPATTFALVRSTAVSGANCLPNTQGTGKIFKKGNVEQMTLTVQGLPKNKEFDVFVIQQPDPTFGLTWYQGDIKTDNTGKGTQSYLGRFSIETFIVAPGAQPVPPPVHDADQQSGNNPAIAAPIHTFHVGVWFNSPDDAQAAGCPGATTPFNGDHTAGVQVLKTENNADGRGPLANVD